MSDCMRFPDTVEEFMEQYKMTDTKQVYSNGTEYVPIFRMEQWFEHERRQPEPHEGHWIEVAGELECSECHTVFTDLYPDYADSVACPHCGAKMKGAEHETD